MIAAAIVLLFTGLAAGALAFAYSCYRQGVWAGAPLALALSGCLFAALALAYLWRLLVWVGAAWTL